MSHWRKPWSCLLLTLGGGLQWLDNAWGQLIADYDIIRGALVICSALIISSLSELPFDYYRTFTIDEKFGFNKMTPSCFLVICLNTA
jgi:STE24 endopeptidase